MLDQRGRLLMAALGCAGCAMPSYDRALHALRTWLDSWSGLGAVVVGMAHQGYDLQLTRYDDRGWRATFYTTGMEHSPTSATAPRGSARRGTRRWGVEEGRAVTLLADRDAFLQEHRRCGDLDSAVEGDRVSMTCTRGAAINRSADDV
jgi:hypothetical protein